MHAIFLLRRSRLVGCGLVLLLAFSTLVPVFHAVTRTLLTARPWMNTALTPDQRADELIAQMTLDQKVAMLHGVAGSYIGYVPAIPSLGIPALNLEDGPAGVADSQTQVTAFPAPIAGAASWDTSLMNQYGQALGSEEAGKGANVVLGPTINILRNPEWGRSFESLGEDPYLTGQLAASEIQGIQSQGVIATVKHFAAYNQEDNRGGVDAEVDERTLHEIYLPAFQAAVQQGGAGAVMCSYNMVDTIYACENPFLLNQTLDQQWGFPGFVMSDWGATHSTVAAADSGLDMEMWDGSYFGTPLETAVQNGQVSMNTLNNMVHRVLRTMFAAGLFDHPPVGSLSANVASSADDQFALQTEEQGTVLLKNSQNLLPLNSGQLKSIAVIGPGGSVNPKDAGVGSAGVIAPFVVTPLQGITARAGSGVNVQYAEGTNPDGSLPAIQAQYLTPSSGGGNGLLGQYYNNMTLSGTPVLTRVDQNFSNNWNGNSPGPGVNADNWSVRWTGTLTAPATGTYTFTLTSDDGSRLYLNNQLLIDNWRDQWPYVESGEIQLTAGQSVPIEVDYYQDWGGSQFTLGWNAPGLNSPFNQAVQLAQSSNVAIVVANDLEAEGTDRFSLAIDNAQEQLIEAIVQANPHTIVVLNTGAPVLMPWVNQAQAIVEAWYPGQEDGNALAAVLFGDVNPSGKLPMTFPASANDVPANTPAQYPGVNNVAQYSEGVFVGYRHYDEDNITPLFPFGYGLSYTTFSFSNLTVSPTSASPTSTISVSVNVTNTGSRAGAEVAQLYLGIPSTNVPEPPKQLKGFQKVFLQPGQTETVTFSLSPQAYSYWDVNAHNWLVQNGTYQVMVGDSSRNILQQTSFTVSGSPPPPPPPSGTAIRIAAGSTTGVAPAAWMPAFSADTDFAGGTAAGSGASVDLTGVTNPAPESVYQNNRGGNFTYTIPGLTPGGSYTVRLDFAETYWTQAGQRVFNVSMNGEQMLSNFDIIAAAGGPDKAVAEQFAATADSGGKITIQFTSVVDNAEVSGIEVLSGSAVTPTPTPIPTSTPTPTPTPPSGSGGVQINAGGSAVGSFIADTDYSGGGVGASTTSAIDTSGVSNPAPQAVYQTNRVGPSFSYTIPNLTPGGTYTVRLDFAETYWTAAGKRVFNVSINGNQVLTNFDIFATAGAANKAVAEQFTATASSSGAITIQFTSVVDQAQINGIEVS
ncbi:MAG TPA: glycoside hydrolase family 3 C-terminal domain-containing protein [Ktedonobacteraceae bacterium]|nr:glycoside hydrolase family 3 C-terminal domain-containing protein [Ktedonobacteraceae bacterium]